MNQKEDETAWLDFLDFVFTVAMGIGLTPEVLGEKFRGLLSESWVHGTESPSGIDLYNLGVFVLGFLTLTLSWFGYHASIRSKPLTYTTTQGMFRFIMDVALVIIYGFILLEFRNYGRVLFLLVIVHCMRTRSPATATVGPLTPDTMRSRLESAVSANSYAPMSA